VYASYTAGLMVIALMHSLLNMTVVRSTCYSHDMMSSLWNKKYHPAT